MPDELRLLTPAELDALVATYDGRTKAELAEFRRTSVSVAKKLRQRALRKLSPPLRQAFERAVARKSPRQFHRLGCYADAPAA